MKLRGAEIDTEVVVVTETLYTITFKNATTSKGKWMAFNFIPDWASIIHLKLLLKFKQNKWNHKKYSVHATFY